MFAPRNWHLASFLALAFSSFSLAWTLAFGIAQAGEETFYLGTYTNPSSGSQGIYEGALNSETGKLTGLHLAATAPDPSYLALNPDGSALYACEETPGTGQVQGFTRAQDGTLSPLATRAAGGAGTCYVSVDPSGRDLLAANYGNGSIACFRLEKDGSVGSRTALVQLTGTGPNADRQEGPHAHSIYPSPDGRFVYACDLGSDRVWIFKLAAATGSLVANVPPYATVPPGSGPRHLAFSRDGRRVYVANEMGHSVTVFARDLASGNLHALETVPTLAAATPPGLITTAEIALHPSGKWLYVSNRGCDTLAVLAVAADGRLKLVQSAPAEVNFPRGFALDPKGHWLISAGQKDNRISVLKIDPATGRLTATGESAQVGSPVCVLFARP